MWPQALVECLCEAGRAFAGLYKATLGGDESSGGLWPWVITEGLTQAGFSQVKHPLSPFCLNPEPSRP